MVSDLILCVGWVWGCMDHVAVSDLCVCCCVDVGVQ